MGQYLVQSPQVILALFMGMQSLMQTMQAQLAAQQQNLEQVAELHRDVLAAASRAEKQHHSLMEQLLTLVAQQMLMEPPLPRTRSAAGKSAPATPGARSAAPATPGARSAAPGTPSQRCGSCANCEYRLANPRSRRMCLFPPGIVLNQGQLQAAKAKDKEVRAADRLEVEELVEAGSENTDSKRKRKKLRKEKKRVAEAKERDDMPDGKPDEPDDGSARALTWEWACECC